MSDESIGESYIRESNLRNEAEQSDRLKELESELSAAKQECEYHKKNVISLNDSLRRAIGELDATVQELASEKNKNADLQKGIGFQRRRIEKALQAIKDLI